jgi:hypothetical protein
MDPLGSADHTLGNPSICHCNGFSTRSRSNEKWLVASSCPHVSGRLLPEFDTGDFMEICHGGLDLGKVGQQYRALQTNL